MRNELMISLFLICIVLAILAGCNAALGDDGKVIDTGHEGYDKVSDDLISVNDLSGSALSYKLLKIETESHEYYQKIVILNPDTDLGKTKKRVLLDFFSNAEQWSIWYQKYLKTDNNSDLDKANLYKEKMMDAVREMK
jgi:hypothetical protein